MNAREVLDELSRLQPQAARLEAQLATWDARLHDALRTEPRLFSESDANEARGEKAAAERRLRPVRERIAALRAQLPTEQEVNQAQVEAIALSEQAIITREALRATFREFTEALENTQRLGERLQAARHTVQSCEGRIDDLVRRYGIDRPQPTGSLLEPKAAKYAHLLATALSEVPYGEPDDVTVRNLDAVRAALDVLVSA